LLKRTLSRRGFEVRRSNSKGDILAEIIYDLDRAELVVADLTSLNPNVMYELGIRHAFTKKTIVLTQDLSELPFDLRAYHCIQYKWQTREDQRQLAADIGATLKDIESNPSTTFGPVHSHLGTKRLALREEEKRANLRKVAALGGELYHVWRAMEKGLKHVSAEFPKVFEDQGEHYKIHYDEIDPQAISLSWAAMRSGWAISYPSLDLLIATQYIPEEFDRFSDIRAFTTGIGRFRLNMFSLDNTLLSMLSVRHLLDCLTDDVEAIYDAIENDRFAQSLDLRSREFLDDEDE
jgi:hypothetical protein